MLMNKLKELKLKNIIILTLAGLINAFGVTIFLEVVDRLDRSLDQFENTSERQLEGIHRAFQSLQEVYTHESLDTLFTASLRQIVPLVVSQVNVLRQLAGEDVIRRCVNAQC